MTAAMDTPSPPVGAGWTAVVLAGQRPGIDPLADAFGERWKALIPVAGEPMLSWVVATLLTVPAIARIIVLAQEPEALMAAVPDDPRIRFHASRPGISDSLRDIVGGPKAPWPVLVTTADHPLLTRAMVETFMDGATDCDVAIGMVEHRTMLAAYPQTRRTWLRFRDGAYSGANLFALRTPAAARALDLWARAEQDRKQAFRLFWHFGPLLALRAITRTIGLRSALALAGRRLGLDAKLVDLPFAEAAIDVDKPADHALVEAIVASRQIHHRTN